MSPGATSGSVTVTAVQDELDEPDETVVVDIVAVAGGTESGAQQQTTTITDDDEPPVPDVTLALDAAAIAEDAGVATFTVNLSQTTTVPVIVDLSISGTADASDFVASATQVTIAPGATRDVSLEWSGVPNFEFAYLDAATDLLGTPVRDAGIALLGYRPAFLSRSFRVAPTSGRPASRMRPVTVASGADCNTTSTVSFSTTSTCTHSSCRRTCSSPSR